MISKTKRFVSLSGAALVVITTCLLANAVHTKEKDANKAQRSEVLVGIASPERNGKRTISFSKGFPVVITNLSNRPLGVWREWCSWGYFNLSLEVRTSDGRKVQLEKKRDRGWTRNFPDWYTLDPGESVIRNIVLTDKDWKGIEDLKVTGNAKLFIRVVMDVSTTDESKEKGVWSGKIVSPERLYHVESIVCKPK